MSAGLADTSVLIARRSRVSMASLPERISISVVTLAELEAGVLLATEPEVRAIRVAGLARVRSEYVALPITASVASIFARLVSAMRQDGRHPQVNDTWIAATAVDAGLPVYTRDAGFDAMPGVEVVYV